MGTSVQLHWEDYLVFSTMLAGSCAIGVYYSCRRVSKGSTEDYLVGDRNMSLLPVIFSLAASYISAILFLGYPAETFAYGGQYLIRILGVALGAGSGVLLFVPIIYPLKLTSVNEYLWRRFESRLVQAMGCLTSLVGLTLYSSAVFYAPSLALSAVSPIPSWVSVVMGMLIAIFYTTLGGIRAVVWTDVFQSAIMFVGMLAVIIRATYVVGGFGDVWQLNGQYDRLNFFVFEADPTSRVNFWSLTVGVALTFSSVYTIGQMAVQRYSSLPTLRQANIAILGLVPCVATLTLLACLCGLVIFAYYAQVGCDPVQGGAIESANQVMMYFASDALALPSLPGLFMAAVWAGSLSSASSAFNSGAANIWHDLLKHQLTVSDARATLIIKGLVVIMGAVSTGLALLMLQFGGGIVEIMATFASTMAGPSSAMFLLGGFFPWVNWQGASAGVLVGLIYGNWLSFGSFMFRSQHPVPPLSAPTYNCTGRSQDQSLTTESSFVLEPNGVDQMYALSFLWYKGIIMGLSLVVMITVTFITGYRDPRSVPPELLHPWIRYWMGYQKEDKSKLSPEHLSKTNTKESSAFTNEGFNVCTLSGNTMYVTSV